MFWPVEPTTNPVLLCKAASEDSRYSSVARMSDLRAEGPSLIPDRGCEDLY